MSIFYRVFKYISIKKVIKHKVSANCKVISDSGNECTNKFLLNVTRNFEINTKIL